MAKNSADQPGAGDEELLCQTEVELISSLPVPVDPRPLPGDVTHPDGPRWA